MLLAVAMGEAGKQTDDLQVALHATPFEFAVEIVDLRRYRQTGGAGFLPVTHHQIEHELFVPVDKGIAQQRDKVVGQRAVHRVLEVEQRRTLGGQHQIAHGEVAMHEQLLLAIYRRQQGLQTGIPQLALGKT